MSETFAFYSCKMQGGYYGFLPEIAESVAAMSNFTLGWTNPEDMAYGAVDADGRWNGMIGMLHRLGALWRTTLVIC